MKIDVLCEDIPVGVFSLAFYVVRELPVCFVPLGLDGLSNNIHYENNSAIALQRVHNYLFCNKKINGSMKYPNVIRSCRLLT